MTVPSEPDTPKPQEEPLPPVPERIEPDRDENGEEEEEEDEPKASKPPRVFPTTAAQNYGARACQSETQFHQHSDGREVVPC
jgi:hypothetical protein